MSTLYVAVITNAGNPSAGALAVAVPGGRAGDTILNIVVLVSGGSVPVGTDVTASFSGPVQAIPTLTNLNPSGALSDIIVHQGATDFTGYTLLALMQHN